MQNLPVPYKANQFTDTFICIYEENKKHCILVSPTTSHTVTTLIEHWRTNNIYSIPMRHACICLVLMVRYCCSLEPLKRLNSIAHKLQQILFCFWFHKVHVVCMNSTCLLENSNGRWKVIFSAFSIYALFHWLHLFK